MTGSELWGQMLCSAVLRVLVLHENDQRTGEEKYVTLKYQILTAEPMVSPSTALWIYGSQQIYPLQPLERRPEDEPKFNFVSFPPADYDAIVSVWNTECSKLWLLNEPVVVDVQYAHGGHPRSHRVNGLPHAFLLELGGVMRELKSRIFTPGPDNVRVMRSMYFRLDALIRKNAKWYRDMASLTRGLAGV